MPFSAAVAAAMPAVEAGINAGGGLLSGVLNRKWSSKMYGRQYDDSIKFWNMQNAYNSPAAQMQRFQDAGLNPNLVYGQGTPGNAASIPTPDVTSAPFPEINVRGLAGNVMSRLLAQADLRIKAAQANNLEEQTEVIRQDANLRRLQAGRADFDLNFERGLEGTSADARREGLRKLKSEIDVLQNRDAREAALNSSNVQEAAQRMLTMIEQRKSLPLERGRTLAETSRTYEDIRRIRENVSLMQQDGVLKKFEIALREQGINPNDPLWARYVGMFLSDIYDGRLTPSTIAGSVWRWITGD